MSVLQF